MSGKGFSGKNGTVKYGSGTSLLEVTKWSFEPKTNVPKYASNATGGFKTGVAGVRDSSGKVEIKVPSDTGLPLQDGDSVTLQLHVDATGSNYFSVPAIISGMPVDCDVDGGEIVGATYNFEGNGAWTGYGILAQGGGSGSGT